MENCKSILISLIQYQFIVSLIMVLMNAIVHDIIHGSTSIMKPKVIYHKKSVDRVTGNFLLRVVALLGGLASEASSLFQPTCIGQVAFCPIRNTPLRLFDETVLFSQSVIMKSMSHA
jgi:hypothetical protein